jgi:Xaa-Pro dipeptidase
MQEFWVEAMRGSVKARQQRAAAALDARLAADELVVVWSGEPVPKPGGFDQCFPFSPHPLYFWLSACRRPGGAMAYSRSEGWVHYLVPISREERVWEGASGTWSEPSVDILHKKIATHRRVYHLDKTPADDATFNLRIAVDQVRRQKDAAEISLIKTLASHAEKGYAAASKIIRPGISEREIQLAYESAVLTAGAEKMPYETIVGAGSNAAILHAIPTHRKLAAGELVLMDAGADLWDYCVDITRVFSADGKFSPMQKELYDVVLAAQAASIARCRVGNEWYSVHEASARVIADGLRSWGLLTCSVDEALETGAVSVFFPHGVGHLVGLRVRDTGCEENRQPKRRFGVNLRVDFALKENYLMTVEPGCYFIDALIRDSQLREQFATQINFAKAEDWLSIGGVRIEDDILITNGESENLTAVVPK